MTDPNETANLVEPLLAAWRERKAEIRAERPLSLAAAGACSFPDQVDRYRELADRDLTARSIATLKARGEWTEERARTLDPDKYPALTAEEHLEVLALGENIARYYRHPSQVDHAARAGASWDQIAAATGTTESEARGAYREWAEGQHQYAGMSDGAYAEAIELAGQDAPEPEAEI